jgi:membrane-bound lytic murein transglycosylase A
VLRNRHDWQELCAIAEGVNVADSIAIHHFFEAFFNPYQVIDSEGIESGLITGYYEPLLKGSRQRGGVYQTPLYKVPSDLLIVDMASLYPQLKGMRLRGRLVGNKVVPYANRAELLQSDALAGQEICWVDDPVDAFFLQIQGSGRVWLTDSKETIRLAYADQNGQPYRSVGRYLVDKGELKLEQASAQGIKNWIANNATRENELLNANPSYVFFKEERITDPNIGPKGALGVALSEKRSIAIDPKFLPLGAPVFIETTQPDSTLPLKRLMMAQDTGGAIQGAIRADFFWGFGTRAGEMAGRMKQRGKLWILWPKLASLPLGELTN